MGLFNKLGPDTSLGNDTVVTAPATPNLDRHLEAMQAADALKAEGNPSMSPIMIAQLVIMGMGLITDLVKAIRASRQGADVDDAVFESASGFLAKVGTQAGVKELNQENISALLPAVRALISKVHELRQLNA
jgi:hypothetical protein